MSAGGTESLSAPERADARHIDTARHGSALVGGAVHEDGTIATRDGRFIAGDGSHPTDLRHLESFRLKGQSTVPAHESKVA